MNFLATLSDPNLVNEKVVKEFKLALSPAPQFSGQTGRRLKTDGKEAETLRIQFAMRFLSTLAKQIQNFKKPAGSAASESTAKSNQIPLREIQGTAARKPRLAVDPKKTIKKQVSFDALKAVIEVALEALRMMAALDCVSEGILMPFDIEKMAANLAVRLMDLGYVKSQFYIDRFLIPCIL